MYMYVRTYIRNCERSELSGRFNSTDFLYIYLFQAVRRTVNVLDVSIYVYLNIRPMRYSAMQI